MDYKKQYSEIFVKKLTIAGWTLTYGNWEENYNADIGQEMIIEDESNVLVVSYPNVFTSSNNPDNHISILINDKINKKYAEFGFDFKNETDLIESLDILIKNQNELSLNNFCNLIKNLLNIKLHLTWEHQGQIMEELNQNNIYTEKYIIPQF